MRTSLCIFGLALIAGTAYFITRSDTNTNSASSMQSQPQSASIIPIEHASAIIQWGAESIFTDPTGGAQLYEGKSAADIILLTDIHGDHLNPETLTAVLTEKTTLIAPQAVKDALPVELAARVTLMKNGDTLTVKGFTVTAIPMYNLPETADSKHAKGRGNGYLIEKDGYRVYIAGDTAGIPEMRALTAIDIALIPMNLPYTMSVEEAADATLAFKPKTVYPYHYRGPDGLADVAKFKQLVNAGDPAINVVLTKWYPSE